jgi:hypothetical protein
MTRAVPDQSAPAPAATVRVAAAATPVATPRVPGAAGEEAWAWR